MYVYFYLFTRAGLARLDFSYLEADKSLGAGRWRTAFAVTLPLLSPALSGAALLTFMTSLASFSAPYVFGGSFRVMTTQIVASKLNGDIGLAMVETVASRLIERATTPFCTSMTRRAVCGRSAKVDIQPTYRRPPTRLPTAAGRRSVTPWSLPTSRRASSRRSPTATSSGCAS